MLPSQTHLAAAAVRGVWRWVFWSLQQLLLGAQGVLGVQAEITLWQLAGSEGQPRDARGQDKVCPHTRDSPSRLLQEESG